LQVEKSQAHFNGLQIAICRLVAQNLAIFVEKRAAK
jgi:hypothetical protein